jgi:hypothetical protein
MSSSSPPTIDNVHEFVSDIIPSTITSFVNGQGLPVRSTHSQIIDDIEIQFANRTPISGRPICNVQIPTPDKIESATQLSYETFHNQSRLLSHTERGKVLNEMAERVKLHSQTLAVLESYDTGIPISQIETNHIPLFVIETLQYYSSLATSGRCIKGSIIQTNDYVSYTKHEPLGVCVGIGGWNYPLMTFPRYGQYNDIQTIRMYTLNCMVYYECCMEGSTAAQLYQYIIRFQHTHGTNFGKSSVGIQSIVDRIHSNRNSHSKTNI